MKQYWTDNKGHFTCKKPSYRKLAHFENGKQISSGWIYVGWFWSIQQAKRDYKADFAGG